MSRRPDAFSTQVPPDLQARVRATVRGIVASTRRDYTMAQLVEEALAEYCGHLENLYNDGKSWPTTPSRLRPGPRV